MQEHFPELQISQPEYTVIKHLEHITDGTGFSNLDNKTGYDYDNEFEYSGHVAKSCQSVTAASERKPPTVRKPSVGCTTSIQVIITMP